VFSAGTGDFPPFFRGFDERIPEPDYYSCNPGGITRKFTKTGQ
jgi:hypothetical protein